MNFVGLLIRDNDSDICTFERCSEHYAQADVSSPQRSEAATEETQEWRVAGGEEHHDLDHCDRLVWRMEFVSDSLVNGQKLKSLAV